jgi:hypothetical protein
LLFELFPLATTVGDWQLIIGGSCRSFSSIISADRFLEVWKKKYDDNALYSEKTNGLVKNL